MLGQSSKSATVNVVRPYAAAAGRTSSKTYAPAFNSTDTTGAAITAQYAYPTSKRLSTRSSAPQKLHIQAELCPTTLNGRSMLASTPKSAMRGPTYMTKRARSTIAELFRGNEEYMASMSKDNPGLLATLANEGQRPPFMLVDCSDSRVNEQGIFSAQPGTIFTAGNIANRFDEDDLNSNAVLSFAVETLKVKHVVVMGHYGCGGVAAAMVPLTGPPKRPADVAVQGWIEPIRHIYETSTREEIVAHREKHKTLPLAILPRLHDPAFRALVEENVKSNVQKIANSAVVCELFAASVPVPSSPPIDPDTLPEIYIHGWVYDVENGKVSDLNVSVGPPGRDLPFSPFPVIPPAGGAVGECKAHGGGC
ncbi:carbonic anhydrase [Pholiota conissans]|uniref:carbonic anhydrase n=1 Tax=Pholiota conissans TaxID=109636 RepID=A0A9P5YXX5_9AGAR|nr:carbonic anhydrase [Pholiota conissans]